MRIEITQQHAMASMQCVEGDEHWLLKERTMLILLIILLLLMFGAFPTWPHSRNWGYYPSGGLGLILVIVLIIVLMDHGI
jgi:hypothetical protein